ncbi:MAG: YhcH/YjgK/YiaL family protein [Victivallales bacterium]|nr:YhcH/YjgK/YiaL family protein [Victivallales bacterium]
MIHDTLSLFATYSALHPRFGKIVKWLEETDLNALTLGQHQILPNGEAFANVQEIAVRPPDEIPAECHRKYIDIQIPITGTEKMGWQPLDKFPKDIPFSEEKDVALAQLPPFDWITVKPGEFVVFFPTDVHTPGWVDETNKKIIIKVLK